MLRVVCQRKRIKITDIIIIISSDFLGLVLISPGLKKNAFKWAFVGPRRTNSPTESYDTHRKSLRKPFSGAALTIMSHAADQRSSIILFLFLSIKCAYNENRACRNFDFMSFFEPYMFSK